MVRARNLIFGKGVVGVAIEPTLAGLSRRDDGMADRARVFAGVAIRRAVAAKGDAAFLACPEMNPGRADFLALFAREATRPFDRFHGFNMRAFAGRDWILFGPYMYPGCGRNS